MPTDRRVVALGQTLGMTTRNAWAVTAEAWAWLQAEAGDDGAVPGTPGMLDTVVDVEGLGAALVTAGLVSATAENIILPDELVRASRLLDGGGDAVAADRRRQSARARTRRWRKRNGLSGRTTARKTTSTFTPMSSGGQQAAQRRRPRRLGVACGHDVMLLDGKMYGAYVQLTGAKPPLSATVEHLDYDTLSLADALELLVPIHESHEPKGGGHRVPRLADLDAASKAARDRQRAADADAARQAEGNEALLEAAVEADADADERHGDAQVTPVTRHDRHGDGFGDASGKAASATSPSVGTELDAVPRDASGDAPRAADAASSSSSSLLGSLHARQKTTTTTTSGSSGDHERDRSPRVPETEPEWLRKDREARQRAMAERWATALGVTVADVVRDYRADKAALRVRLEAVGINPDTGFPAAGRDEPVRATSATSASSAARVAGIPLPDLGVDRLRAVADHGDDADQGGDDDRDEILDQGDDQGVDEVHHDRDVDADDDHADRRVDEIHEPVTDLGVDDHDEDHEPADRLPSPATADAVT